MLSVYSEEDNFSDTDKTIVYFVLAYAKTYKTHFELLKVCSLSLMMTASSKVTQIFSTTLHINDYAGVT